ncbi:MAG: metallophosphoesterase family protein [Saprospiraceae bacterium]
MKEIALISDNHSYFGDDIKDAVAGCDEVWHAGDVGDIKSIEYFLNNFECRGVHGNIDDRLVRDIFPETLFFECEGLQIYMKHIGGYPGRYNTIALQDIKTFSPDLFISGHSHILKVMRDEKLDLIHFNPGSYGLHGFHQVRTILKFSVDQGKIKNVRIVELGLRGKQ